MRRIDVYGQTKTKIARLSAFRCLGVGDAADFGHTGGSTGGTSALEIYPDSKVVVAILTNLSGAPLKSDDPDRIAELFMK